MWRVDRSTCERERLIESPKERRVRSCFCYYYRALVLSHLSAWISFAMTSLFSFHFQSVQILPNFFAFLKTHTRTCNIMYIFIIIRLESDFMTCTPVTRCPVGHTHANSEMQRPTVDSPMNDGAGREGWKYGD